MVKGLMIDIMRKDMLESRNCIVGECRLFTVVDISLDCSRFSMAVVDIAESDEIDEIDERLIFGE